MGNSRFHGSSTLVEHWNGNHWAIVASPNPTGSDENVLHAVSCPSTTSCSAVGFGSTKGLVEHWNGHTWSIVTRPNPTGSDNWYLAHVSCATTTSCFAVGSYWSGEVGKSPEKTLAEHWNGHTWSITPSPNPAGSASTVLNGVSCPTATQCFAVGHSSYQVSLGRLGVGTAQKTLVQHWDGHTWSTMRSRNPSPGGYETTVLNGVSCHRKTSCFAVGDFGGHPDPYPVQVAGNTTNLIERYG